MSATDGFWDQKVGQLNTKLRQVDVSIDNVHIVNDGDSSTVGEAEFWITVYATGSLGLHTPAHTFHFGNDEYEINDGQDIPLSNWTVTIGPKKVEPLVNQIVAMQTNALEYDGIKGTDKAGSDGYDASLTFPAGRDSEEFAAIGNVKGLPLASDNFEYRVKFSYTVTYV